jgi:hypothetical protein
MRATSGRIAVVGLVIFGVSGCTSSPTWSSLAWWRKRPDTTATAGGNAPKFNATAAALPSANQNPNNSLAGIANPAAAATANPAAINPGGAAGLSGYGATPVGYQNPMYPTTPYPPAKLGSAASPPGTTSPWVATAQNPNPTLGYGAAGTTPSQYAPGVVANTTPNYAAAAGATMSANSTVVAAAPSYGAAAAGTAPSSFGQPQSGFYNPTYDGGGSANRYVSTAPIPGTAQTTAPDVSAAVAANGMPSYRTADARSVMGAAPAAGATLPTTAVGSPTAPAAVSPSTDDRYSGITNANAGSSAINPAPMAGTQSVTTAVTASSYSAMGDRYAQPPVDNRPAAGGYDSSNTSYQPTASSNPIGNTGYSPPNVYSPTTPAGNAGQSSLPAQSDTEYRPGGTSNYVSPAGIPVQPSTGSNSAPSDNHGSVTPASYQSTGSNSGSSPSGVTLASAASSSNEMYGAYQGAGTSGSTSQPVYSSPNPTAATPALLPVHSAW